MGYIDVAIDGLNANFISVLDALLVINFLNTPGGESEATATAAVTSTSSSEFADLIALLAIDSAEEATRRRRSR